MPPADAQLLMLRALVNRSHDQRTREPSWGHRLVGVEGVRALAAVSVLVGHVLSRSAARPRLGVITPEMSGMEAAP